MAVRASPRARRVPPMIGLAGRAEFLGGPKFGGEPEGGPPGVGGSVIPSGGLDLTPGTQLVARARAMINRIPSSLPDSAFMLASPLAAGPICMIRASAWR